VYPGPFLTGFGVQSGVYRCPRKGAIASYIISSTGYQRLLTYIYLFVQLSHGGIRVVDGDYIIHDFAPIECSIRPTVCLGIRRMRGVYPPVDNVCLHLPSKHNCIVAFSRRDGWHGVTAGTGLAQLPSDISLLPPHVPPIFFNHKHNHNP
jgi:hypothetical protein